MSSSGTTYSELDVACVRALIIIFTCSLFISMHICSYVSFFVFVEFFDTFSEADFVMSFLAVILVV